MRRFMLAALLVPGLVTTASAQPASRFEVGPILRLDRASFEGGASGRTTAAGAVATVKLSRNFGVEVEVTQTSGAIERSYEGWFISYATGSNATRDEIERMAPVARRSVRHQPGIGWAAAFTARQELTPRVSLGARIGASARDYVQSSTYTILSIPDGIDPARVARDFQDSSSVRRRGGLLFGFDGSVNVTRHLRVVPDVRFVYGGPARVGNNYREAGLGVRAVWQF